jgi:osmoprotectant transport system permease protein
MFRYSWIALLLGWGLVACLPGQSIRLASKKFTENVILAEIAAAKLKNSGFKVENKGELGGTRILWKALQQGEIDIYPEYSGTLRYEIFAGIENADLEAELARVGLAMTPALGFNNTYALAVPVHLAGKYDLVKTSDLKKYPQLRFGLTSEFLQRRDGWPGLRATYQLAPAEVNGLDHDLAYAGIRSGAIDVIDVYTTDAEIDHYNLAVLRDDRNYFPEYNAMYLYRQSLDNNAVRQLVSLRGAFSDTLMIRLNALAKITGKSTKKIAATFLQERFGINMRTTETTMLSRLINNSLDHLALVGLSMFAAVLLAIPVGILAARQRRLGALLIALSGIMQTIPALALLVFMIPIFGIGAQPAIAALFIYSLLPVIRNTHMGLVTIPSHLLEAARAMALSPIYILLHIELPLARAAILSGIKTAVVINIGTATLGALIGAGGYGQPILTGIRLADTSLILQGAIPAALLAILAQICLDQLEKRFTPRGLRQ